MLFRSLQHYLLIAVTFAFGLGIYFSSHTELLLSKITVILTAMGLAAAAFLWQNKTVFCHILLLALFFVLGWFNGTLSAQKPADPTDISNQTTSGDEVVLTGFLHDLPAYNGEKSTGVINIKSFRRKNDSHFIPASGLVKLTLRHKWPTEIAAGDRIAVRATLFKPGGYRNPGGFDYQQFLLEKNIRVTGRIISPLHVAPINHFNTFRERFFYWPQRLRTKISRAIDKSVPERYAPLYKAVLIGDRSAVDNKMLELFKTAGCMHILAISGLHMGIISAFLYCIFFWLLTRSEWLIMHISTRKTAALLCFAPLILYTLIAGANTPVVRSFLMSAVVILCLCVNRRKHPITIVSLAALIILTINPQSLFAASFQLSFAAVTSIIAALPVFTEYYNQTATAESQPTFFQKSKSWLLSALFISLAATIGVLPFLIYHFNRFSLVGPLANLIVEPLICFWSLILGFLGIGFLSVSEPVAQWFFQLGSLGFVPAISTLEVLGRLPFASIYLPTPPAFLLMLYGISFVSIVTIPTGKFLIIRFGIFALLLTLFFIPSSTLFSGLNNRSTITYIDVGHGSSTLVQFPGNTAVLIDGGAITSKSFNIGERVIAPYLWHQGIRRLEGVIITHSDGDHYNGLFFILKHFKPPIIWTNRLKDQGDSYDDLLKLAKEIGTEVRIPKEGQFLFKKSSASLFCQAHPRKNSLVTNDSGLIIGYRHDGFSALFPGDISSSVEKQLVEKEMVRQANILLSPHHGSATSNSVLFLKTIQPKLLVVSNRRRYSDSIHMKKLHDRCRKFNIDIAATGESGAIIVKTDGKVFDLKRFIE